MDEGEPADLNDSSLDADKSIDHEEGMNGNAIVSVDLERFQVELEFVQCLANPFYLNYLAQHGYFERPEFVNYIKYLLYWKQPEYAVFVKYPVCLHMLELLQQEAFRRELVNPPCAKFIEEQLLLHWQFGSFRRQMAASGGHVPASTAAATGGLVPPSGTTPVPNSSVAGSVSSGPVTTAANSLTGQNSVSPAAQPVSSSQ